MNGNENIIAKINSKYIFNNIFEYTYLTFFKYNLIKYSKLLQEKFEISKTEFEKISSIISLKLIYPEIILENKNKLLAASKEIKTTFKELMKKIIPVLFEKKMKDFFENNELEYFPINNEKMIELLIQFF